MRCLHDRGKRPAAKALPCSERPLRTESSPAVAAHGAGRHPAHTGAFPQPRAAGLRHVPAGEHSPCAAGLMQRAERAAVLPCRPVPAPLPFPSPASRPGGSACMLHGGRSERRFLPRKAGSAATRLPGSAGRRTRRIMKQAFFPPPSGHGGGYGCTLRKISFEITRFQNTLETRAEDPAAQSAGLLRRVCREVSRLPRGAFPGTGSRALSHTGAFPGACLTGRQFSSFFRCLPGRGELHG